MVNSYQQAAFRRKLIYIGLFLGLGFVSIFVRGLIAMPTPGLQKSVGKWAIQRQADQLDLNELSHGDVDLTSSAVRLLLTGSRGFAVCALWMSAQDKQIHQDWNKLELRVNSVTKLQPHFVTPWLFQSWNVAYNVSVEMDNLNDMYFYIARGISLLAQGESLNHYDPNIRYFIGFYYQNKFTVSDKVTTLRCLFELSCIPKEERSHLRVQTGGELDLRKFREFCEKYPQFVRRLRETAIPRGKGADGNELAPQYLARSPAAVMQFLQENEVLPNRYRDDNPNVLEEPLHQFPVLPLEFYPNPTEELNPRLPISDGQASAVRAARVWFRYANEAVPPPTPIPAAVDRKYRDPERKRRLPKQPTLVIFVQGPPRAQTFIADQLAKEGWFDSSPWVVDRDRDSIDRWFDEDVEIKPSGSSKAEWEKAHDMWLVHGREQHLNYSPAELRAFDVQSQLYTQTHPPTTQQPMPPLRADEMGDAEMVASYNAAVAKYLYRINTQMTNYHFFLSSAELEQKESTITARKLLFDAEQARRRTNDAEACQFYESAFGSVDKPGPWRSLLLDEMTARARENREIKGENVANSTEKLVEHLAEETAEQQINYLRCLQVLKRSDYQKASVKLFDLMRLSSPAILSPAYVVLDEAFWAERIRSLKTSVPPIWPPGPFDGLAALPAPFEPVPWIPKSIQDRVRQNMYLGKSPTQPKANQPGAASPARP